jgi:hypothetical protein
MSARLADHGLDGAIRQALAPFQETGVPMLWHMGPSSSPPSLPRALAAAGLARYEDEPGMVADLDAWGRGRRRRPGCRSGPSATRTTWRHGRGCWPGRHRRRTSTPW